MPAHPPDACHEGYAAALVALGEAAGVLDRLERDLIRLLDLLREHPDLRGFLSDSCIRAEGKTQALREVLGGQTEPEILHLLEILAERNRLRDLPQIAARFFEKRASLDRMDAGELVAAAPVAPEQVAAIEREAGRILGRSVHVRVRMDPTLLGGLRLRVGDTVVDGTIDRQLELFRLQLLS